jgi:hypothetical protein
MVDPAHVAFMRDAAELEDRESRPNANLQDATVRPRVEQGHHPYVSPAV